MRIFLCKHFKAQIEALFHKIRHCKNSNAPFKWRNQTGKLFSDLEYLCTSIEEADLYLIYRLREKVIIRKLEMIKKAINSFNGAVTG